MIKKRLGALAVATGCATSGVLVSIPAASADQCVGETTGGEDISVPGQHPGNTPAHGKKYRLNSCATKTLVDELRKNSEVDGFKASLIGLIPEIGPAAAAVWAGAHKLNGVTADDIQKTSENFTKGVEITEIDGAISGVQPQ